MYPNEFSLISQKQISSLLQSKQKVFVSQEHKTLNMVPHKLWMSSIGYFDWKSLKNILCWFVVDNDSFVTFKNRFLYGEDELLPTWSCSLEVTNKFLNINSFHKWFYVNQTSVQEEELSSDHNLRDLLNNTSTPMTKFPLKLARVHNPQKQKWCNSFGNSIIVKYYELRSNLIRLGTSFLK